MHSTVKNLININNQINSKIANLDQNTKPTIVAVSKTFKIDHIIPVIEYA